MNTSSNGVGTDEIICLDDDSPKQGNGDSDDDLQVFSSPSASMQMDCYYSYYSNFVKGGQ